MLITLNGIERMRKQYYAGILNQHLKNKYGEDCVRKFSFPSFTTNTGQKLAQLIKQFRQDDLLKPTRKTHFRYKRIAELFLDNVREYNMILDVHTNIQKKVSIVNNYHYFSILAYALAAGVEYKDIVKIIPPTHNLPAPSMSFFLVSKDVHSVLTQPMLTHEVYGPRAADINTLSEDTTNFFTLVNNYYRQIYLACALGKDTGNIFHMIEVDPNSLTHITDTIEKIKSYAGLYPFTELLLS